MSRKEQMITRLNEALHPTYLEVVNESEAHRGHAGYDHGESHFCIIISSPALSALTRIEAHRRIYEALGGLVHEIHAIRIKDLSH